MRVTSHFLRIFQREVSFHILVGLGLDYKGRELLSLENHLNDGQPIEVTFIQIRKGLLTRWIRIELHSFLPNDLLDMIFSACRLIKIKSEWPRTNRLLIGVVK